ncbi:alpha/beta hydrolase [Actinoplanes sp. NPDC049596]
MPIRVIERLDLTDVTLVAHSMGCGVAWAYWDLYRDEYLQRFVLIDQPPVLASFPDWPEDMVIRSGAPHEAVDVPAFIVALRSAHGEELAAGAVETMFTSAMPKEQKAAVVQQMLLTGRAEASALMFSQIALDWRDILAEITIPTLLIGGEASLFAVQYIKDLSAAIPDSKTHVISARDGGSHMVIMENAAAVNAAIRPFIESTPLTRF